MYLEIIAVMEPSNKKMLEILNRIENQLKQLNNKIDLLIRNKSNLKLTRENEEPKDPALDSFALLTLPDHLRKTAMAMNELLEGTAEMVSEKTERRRATESKCLNQLVRMGYLNKKRKGLKVVFFFEK